MPKQPHALRIPPHRRLVSALAGARHRLVRGQPVAGEPLWTAAMIRWLVAALTAALLAGLADEAIIRAVLGSQSQTVRFMAWITNIGKSQWYLVPAGIVFLAVGFYDWSRGGARAKLRLAFLFGQAAYVFLAVASAGIFVDIVKVIAGRVRPMGIDRFGPWYFDPFSFSYSYASFPSGHSATVGAVVGILMVWYPRWAIFIAEFGLFFAATRIAAGAHYPSDVIAGFSVGVFFAVVIARWLARRGVVFRLVPGKTLPVVPPFLPRKSTG
jgi:membrane-associated phospholipid phosphatase